MAANKIIYGNAEANVEDNAQAFLAQAQPHQSAHDQTRDIHSAIANGQSKLSSQQVSGPIPYAGQGDLSAPKYYPQAAPLKSNLNASQLHSGPNSPPLPQQVLTDVSVHSPHSRMVVSPKIYTEVSVAPLPGEAPLLLLSSPPPTTPAVNPAMSHQINDHDTQDELYQFLSFAYTASYDAGSSEMGSPAPKNMTVGPEERTANPVPVRTTPAPKVVSHEKAQSNSVENHSKPIQAKPAVPQEVIQEMPLKPVQVQVSPQAAEAKKVVKKYISPIEEALAEKPKAWNAHAYLDEVGHVCSYDSESDSGSKSEISVESKDANKKEEKQRAIPPNAKKLPSLERRLIRLNSIV